MSRLEEIILEAEKVGYEWVEARQVSNRLQELRKPKLYQIATKISEDFRMNNPGHKEISENKLERLAYASDDYSQFIEDMTEAEKCAETARMKYDALINLFEALRSEYSLKKAEMRMV